MLRSYILILHVIIATIPWLFLKTINYFLKNKKNLNDFVFIHVYHFQNYSFCECPRIWQFFFYLKNLPCKFASDILGAFLLWEKKKQKPAFCFQFWNQFLLQIRCKVDRIFKNILNQFFERCHFGYMIYYDLCGFLMLISQHLMLEKAMAPHSSTLGWKIPRTEEPGRLQSMGSRRVGHDSLSLFTFMHWRRKW